MKTGFKLEIDVREDFKKLALSHYGYDGGNLKSRIWFSGIEWGGGISSQDLEKDIKGGGQNFPSACETYDKRKGYLKNQFDVKLLKILSVSLGYELGDYPKMLEDNIGAYASHGPMMKFNLYPISFRNTSSDHWNEEFYRLTGFPTKELYMAWIQINRFKFLNELVEKNTPKVIVCFGSTFKKDFLLAFGGTKVLFEKPIKTVPLQGKSEIEIFSSSFTNDCVIIVTPFLGNRYGINRDEECKTIGTIVKSYFKNIS